MSMASTFNFWRDRRVLLTGHTGFKGAWLSVWLLHLGARVTGYALDPPTKPSLFERARLGGRLNHVIGNICDQYALVATMQEAKPEVVFHLAAQSLVRESYADPIGTLATNVMGTAHVLEAISIANRRARHDAERVRAALVVTSDKCYENNEWHWRYREIDPLGGHDLYSASKSCAEIVTAAYRTSFFAKGAPDVAIATARAGNVIGGGDWAKDRLVPDAIRAFEAGLPFVIRNPKAVRPWQHVIEPLAGYLKVAELLLRGDCDVAEAWNFGPNADDEMTVLGVAERLVSHWGGGMHWQIDDLEHPHEAAVLRLDSSKACARLGWKPRLSLQEAVGITVEWYRATRDMSSDRVYEFTGEQIRSYEAKAINQTAVATDDKLQCGRLSASPLDSPLSVTD